MVEYCLIVAAIAAVLITTLMGLRAVVSETFEQVTGQLDWSGSTTGPTQPTNPAPTAEPSSAPVTAPSIEPTACTPTPSPADPGSEGDSTTPPPAQDDASTPTPTGPCKE